jgi:hypothetical protein
LTTNKPAEASFKKAIYDNLIEIARRDGAKLTPQQQALLLNVLVKNIKVFSGGGGYYNGQPVGQKQSPARFHIE